MARDGLSELRAALSPYGYDICLDHGVYRVSRGSRRTDSFQSMWFETKQEVKAFIQGLTDGRDDYELASAYDSRQMWAHDGYDKELRYRATRRAVSAKRAAKHAERKAKLAAQQRKAEIRRARAAERQSRRWRRQN